MSPNLDPLDSYGRQGRKTVRRTTKQQLPAHKGEHGRHETQRRRYAADCNEANLEIRNALRSY